jgi:hypothetical protein
MPLLKVVQVEIAATAEVSPHCKYLQISHTAK